MSPYQTTTGLELLGHFKTGIFFSRCTGIFYEVIRRIKHFRLGVDSSREGLNPIPRRDCEQRTGSWNNRTEKCRRNWRSDSESFQNKRNRLWEIVVASLILHTRLSIFHLLHDKPSPFVPPELALLENRKLFCTVLDRCVREWQLYLDTIHGLVCFRHSFFDLGIT